MEDRRALVPGRPAFHTRRPGYSSPSTVREKHTRKITLHEWQQRIVDTHPGLFLRGLIHSDGCRMTNWTRRRVAGEMKRYEYPRYFFTNKSLDILALCCAALDRLGVAYRRPRWDQVSVARREAVAALDVWVGPKT